MPPTVISSRFWQRETFNKKLRFSIETTPKKVDIFVILKKEKNCGNVICHKKTKNSYTYT
jgi:hypothetical protein